MSIFKVSSGRIVNSKVQLNTSRHWASSSSGLTGSVYIFPNRSELQKDNVDSRLLLSQTTPYSAQSFEQRRIEIFAGDEPAFGSGQGFVDNANSYSAGFIFSGVPADNATITVQAAVKNGDLSYQKKIIAFHSSGTPTVSDYNHVINTSVHANAGLIADAVISAINKGIAGKADDGTSDAETWTNNTKTGTHTWREFTDPNNPAIYLDHIIRLTSLTPSKDPESTNSLATVNILSTYPQLGSFAVYESGDSGYKIKLIDAKSNTGGFHDGNYEAALALLLDGANPYESQENWPPEISKPGITQLNLHKAHMGYSDLPMHPRNNTKKDIRVLKAGHDTFSSGSNILQQIARNQIEPARQLGNYKSGNYYSNYNCLNFIQEGDNSFGSRHSALVYVNRTDPDSITTTKPKGQYSPDINKGFTFEFWIKPSKRQTSESAIIHLKNRYGITISPDNNSLDLNGKPTQFFIKYYHGPASQYHTIPHSYQSSFQWSSSLTVAVDTWSHVAIRWGPNFNGKNLEILINNQKDILSSNKSLVYYSQLNPAWTSTFGTSEGWHLQIGAWDTNSSSSLLSFGKLAKDSIRRDGIIPSSSQTTGLATIEGQGNLKFGLQCEISELRIWDYPRTSTLIKTFHTCSLTGSDGLLFYLPVIYDQPSPVSFYHVLEYSEDRAADGVSYPSTILPVLFQSPDSTLGFNENDTNATSAPGLLSPTDFPPFVTSSLVSNIMNAPFNNNHAFMGSIPNINVQAFCKDYANSEYPYLYNMGFFADLVPTHYSQGANTSDIEETASIEIALSNTDSIFATTKEFTFQLKMDYSNWITYKVVFNHATATVDEYFTETGTNQYSATIGTSDVQTNHSTRFSRLTTLLTSLEGFTVEDMGTGRSLKISADIPGNAHQLTAPNPWVTTNGLVLWSNLVAGKDRSSPSIMDLTGSWKNYPSTTRRNNLIFPCDNGNFVPSYEIISSSQGKYFNNKSMISLLGLGDKTDGRQTKFQFADEFANFSDFKDEEGNALDLAINDTMIPDSPDDYNTYIDDFDQISPLQTIIDIPTIFYGDQISPESIEIKAKISENPDVYINIKDDGIGNLYRSNSSGSIAKWNKIGQVFYEHGTILLQSPHIYYVGLFDLDINFKAHKNMYVQEINVPLRTGLFNSSSNPSHIDTIKASGADHESLEEEFIYISEVYLHDENLNVVGKAKFSQPLLKRNNDSYLLRIKMDY